MSRHSAFNSLPNYATLIDEEGRMFSAVQVGKRIMYAVPS